jgi:Spy/CpxP family protein refolding chaperone
MSATTVKQKAALWVGLVFLLGAALGVLIGYVSAHRIYAASSGPETDASRRAQKVARLTQELNLTTEQQHQLDAVLADVMARYRAIHETTEPQIDQERQKGRDRIRAFLTPEQRPRFEDFLKRLDEERKKNSQH